MYAAPVPLHSPRERRTAALAVHGFAVAALMPAFLWLAPPTHWDHPGLLATLLALAVIADFHDATLKTGIRMDAGMALALIALAVAGPLAAITTPASAAPNASPPLLAVTSHANVRVAAPRGVSWSTSM